MDDKLDDIARRYDELAAQMGDPAIYEIPGAYPKLAKEVGGLEPLVRAWRRLKVVRAEMIEAREMLDMEDDPEMKAMAKSEIDTLGIEREALDEKLKFLLLPTDPNDSKNVILEIRGGTGGEEASLFARDLYRMYARYAELRKWKVETLTANWTDGGGLKEVVAQISGNAIYSQLKFEAGVHRVQRVPETESQGRIHTSACTVAILPEAEAVEMDIRDVDLEIQTMRAQGAGGQHVNKTDSAVRIIHKPSGLVVFCQDERSQHKNKAKAMVVLRSRLLGKAEAEAHAERAGARRLMVGSGDRSERIRTYNYPQNRVTDHRIGLTLYKLDEIIEGSMDSVIQPVIAANQAELLKAQAEA
jgi:peptide chain release factor 1